MEVSKKVTKRVETSAFVQQADGKYLQYMAVFENGFVHWRLRQTDVDKMPVGDFIDVPFLLLEENSARGLADFIAETNKVIKEG